MKVCYVTKPERENLLGSPQSLLNLIEAERKLGPIEIMAVSNKNNPFLNVLREAGVNCSLVKGASVVMPKHPTLVQAFKSVLKYPYISMHVNEGVKYLKDKEIDIVHVNDLFCSPTLAYSALKLKIPYIYIT